MTAAYFHAVKLFPGGEVDITEYEWKDPNTLSAQVTLGGMASGLVRITGHNESQDVGHIKDAWIIDSRENYSGTIKGTDCPSIENAVSSGWVYSPNQMLRLLKERTWRRTADNQIIAIPENVEPTPSAATTNVSTYPTYRFEFTSGTTNYKLHFGLMPWKANENQPGFAFESEPEVEAFT